MADPRCRSDFPREEKERMGLDSDVQGVIPAWKMVTPTYASPAEHGVAVGRLEANFVAAWNLSVGFEAECLGVGT